LHHVVLERWSRGASPLHRRDPRAKLAALLVFLVVLATAHRALPLPYVDTIMDQKQNRVNCE
jgi:energy-coupling factor transporter transmembrane protein EcfT